MGVTQWIRWWVEGHPLYSKVAIRTDTTRKEDLELC